MKKHKKILCALAALVMLMSLGSVAALATVEQGGDAPVSGTPGEIDSEEDFKAAVAAGGSYKLTADIKLSAPSLNDPIQIMKEFSLDGKKDDSGNYTISGWAMSNEGYAIDIYTKATFTNINFSGFSDDTGASDEYATIISGWSYSDVTIKNCTFSDYNRQAISFAPGYGGSMTLENCTIDCATDNHNYELQKGIVVQPGTADSKLTLKNCTIKNSRYTTTDWIASAIEVFSGTLMMDGCKIENTDIGLTVERDYYYASDPTDYADYDVSSSVTISNTQFIGCKTAAVHLSNNNSTGKAEPTTARIDIASGSFEGQDVASEDYVGPVVLDNADGVDETAIANSIISITGGTYDMDVSEYCADGYIAKQDTSGEKVKYIVCKIPDAVGDAKVAIQDAAQGETAIHIGADADVERDDIGNAMTVAESVDVDLADAIKDVEIGRDDTKSVVQKLAAAGQVKLDENNKVVPYSGSGTVTVTVIKEPYLEVEVTGLTDTDTGKELKLDITPKYNLFATTDTNDPDKKVTVSTGNPLTVDEDTQVTIWIPGDFASEGDKLLVTHEKNGSEEYYTGTVSDDYDIFGSLYVTFTTHGFSPFTISKDYFVTIGEDDAMQVFPGLQAAVDAAKNGDTIKLLKGDETATVKRTVRFTVDPAKAENENYTYTIQLGERCTRAATDNPNYWDIIYTAPAATTTAASSGAPATDDGSGISAYLVLMLCCTGALSAMYLTARKRRG